jgi:hypothetical protein
MSDETAAPAPDAPAAAPVAEPAPNGCPIGPDFLPPNMKKHVDPKAPVPLRMMCAKALVPLQPPDMVGALFMLTFDADEKVRETAAQTAAKLPDRVLAGALRDEGVQKPVLAWLLEQYWQNDGYAEMLVLNNHTPDDAVARAAGLCSARTAEIIAGNQLRILRDDSILRALTSNPNVPASVIDSVCDFCVRSGMSVDLPQMKEARIRLFGPEAAEAPPDPGPSADAVLQEFGGASEEAPPMEEGQRINFAKSIMKMSVSEKVKLATKGNKEARGILLRDSNRLVAVAAIRNPRITDGEVLAQILNKAVNDDVLREIYGDREYTKQYPFKLALVKNPKTPQAMSMRFLSTLRETDVKNLSRDKNVPNVVQQLARKMMEKKENPNKK